jgi:hypothetical protein
MPGIALPATTKVQPTSRELHEAGCGALFVELANHKAGLDVA